MSFRCNVGAGDQHVAIVCALFGHVFCVFFRIGSGDGSKISGDSNTNDHVKIQAAERWSIRHQCDSAAADQVIWSRKFNRSSDLAAMIPPWYQSLQHLCRLIPSPNSLVLFTISALVDPRWCFIPLDGDAETFRGRSHAKSWFSSRHSASEKFWKKTCFWFNGSRNHQTTVYHCRWDQKNNGKLLVYQVVNNHDIS